METRRERPPPSEPSGSPLIVVVGPTAAGKTALAVRIAEELGGEVVSADSQQVYRRFDIGTGKPTLEERRGVPHHLLDVADPHERFSAARFVELADAAIVDIRARGRRVVVAGGTGLYVRALLRGLFEAPPADPEIRERHQKLWTRDPESLRQQLLAADPEAAARLHPRDLVRISRALEVFEQTGLPISELQRRHGFAAPRYATAWVGLVPPRSVLRGRIDSRVDVMLERGWLSEVRELLREGHGETAPMGCLGYRHLRAHLLGSLDLAEAVRKTKRDTWRFARRQMTWFSTEAGIPWFADGAKVQVSRLPACRVTAS